MKKKQTTKSSHFQVSSISVHCRLKSSKSTEVVSWAELLLRRFQATQDTGDVMTCPSWRLQNKPQQNQTPGLPPKTFHLLFALQRAFSKKKKSKLSQIPFAAMPRFLKHPEGLSSKRRRSALGIAPPWPQGILVRLVRQASERQELEPGSRRNDQPGFAWL